MVNKFPWEVKLGEFGLARDMTRMTSRRSNRWRNPRVRLHARTHTLQQHILASEDLKTDFSLLNWYCYKILDVVPWHSGSGLDAAMVKVALLYNGGYGFKSWDFTCVILGLPYSICRQTFD